MRFDQFKDYLKRQQRAKIVSEGETTEALRGSILKWERIAAGTGIDNGARNCPLCVKFIHSLSSNAEQCKGCPVREKTGRQFCEDTPYQEWLEYHAKTVDARDAHPRRAGGRAAKTIALKEVAFLRSLLPPEAKPAPAATATTVGEAIRFLQQAYPNVDNLTPLVVVLTGSKIRLEVDMLAIGSECVEVRARLPKSMRGR